MSGAAARARRRAARPAPPPLLWSVAVQGLAWAVAGAVLGIERAQTWLRSVRDAREEPEGTGS